MCMSSRASQVRDELVVIALQLLHAALHRAQLFLQALDLRLLGDELFQELLVGIRGLRDDLEVLAQPGLILADDLEVLFQIAELFGRLRDLGVQRDGLR